MNRRDAIEHLHERHPRVIDRPDDAMPPGSFELDLFWFQAHVCELVDGRADRRVRRCFESIGRLLVEGDREVRAAVAGHFLAPDLVFHPDLAWAEARMPRPLAELCRCVAQFERKGGRGEEAP